MGVCKSNTNLRTRSTRLEDSRGGNHGEGSFARILNARLAAELKILEKTRNLCLLCSADAIKRPTGVRTQKKTRGSGSTRLNFWRHSLGNSYGLAKRCSAVGDPSGLDQRPGERVGRGVILLGTTSKPPVAQRAGGIFVD